MQSQLKRRAAKASAARQKRDRAKAARKQRVAKVPRNNSPTLGAFLTNPNFRERGEAPVYAPRVLVVRSLQCVGGSRPTRRYRRKADARARRLGYPTAAAFHAALAKFAAMGGRHV